jgi:hypothetical protein
MVSFFWIKCGNSFLKNSQKLRRELLEFNSIKELKGFLSLLIKMIRRAVDYLNLWRVHSQRTRKRWPTTMVLNFLNLLRLPETWLEIWTHQTILHSWELPVRNTRWWLLRTKTTSSSSYKVQRKSMLE